MCICTCMFLCVIVYVCVTQSYDCSQGSDPIMYICMCVCMYVYMYVFVCVQLSVMTAVRDQIRVLISAVASVECSLFPLQCFSLSDDHSFFVEFLYDQSLPSSYQEGSFYVIYPPETIPPPPLRRPSTYTLSNVNAVQISLYFVTAVQVLEHGVSGLYQFLCSSFVCNKRK